MLLDEEDLEKYQFISNLKIKDEILNSIKLILLIQVWKVESKKNKQLYALKEMSKSKYWKKIFY